MQAKQLAVTLCRTPAEWRASPQGRVVAALEPVTFEGGGDRGPVVTKKRPRRALFDEETNNGKQPLELDLADAADLARLWSLLDAADVLVDGYTEGALAKFGLDEAAVLAVPASSSCGVSCYGHDGPLSAAKGFQQNANFATGVGTIADEDLLGYQLTSQTDSASFLGRQCVQRSRAPAHSGRGELAPMRVRASLCQAATWMAQFGARLPTFRDYGASAPPLQARRPHGVDGNLKYAARADHKDAARARDRLRRWWTDGVGRSSAR
ncbi:alpha-methylacyl-CoA racemase [Aureococcus anophagefferens]|nr:alpha-methylacyl-CoA racemase [Aureococcus anophagefferens]